jgi:hypothetical protein
MTYQNKLNKYLQKGGSGASPVDPLQQVKGSYEINNKIKSYVKLSLVIIELQKNLAQNMKIYLPLLELQASMMGDFLPIINQSLEEVGLLTVENSEAIIVWVHSEIDRLKSITTL